VKLTLKRWLKVLDGIMTTMPVFLSKSNKDRRAMTTHRAT